MTVVIDWAIPTIAHMVHLYQALVYQAPAHLSLKKNAKPSIVDDDDETTPSSSSSGGNAVTPASSLDPAWSIARELL